MNDVTRRALRSSLFGILALAALLFVPAGTLDYWQAWLFMAVFVCTSGAITAYLAIHDPKLLERRMNVGPRAEKEPAQSRDHGISTRSPILCGGGGGWLR